MPSVIPARHCRLQSAVLQDPTEYFYDLYRTGKELGRGNFGVVRQCTNRITEDQLACKTICKATLESTSDRDQIQNEIQIMKKLAGHPSLVQLHGVYEDEVSLHLVMELCRGGELYHYINDAGHLEEEEAAQIFRQVAEALHYCHGNEILHRDVKPENILIADSSRRGGPLNVKLADFGLATEVRRGGCTQGVAGSKYYQAPEVLSNKPYNEKADMWSLGVVLYALLSGRLPFIEPERKKLIRLTKACRLSFEEEPWPCVSESAKQLINKLVTPDPKARLCAAEVLRHPWLQQHCPTLAGARKDPKLLMLHTAPEELTRQASDLVQAEEPSLSLNGWCSSGFFSFSPRPSKGFGGSGGAPYSALPSLEMPPHAHATPLRKRHRINGSALRGALGSRAAVPGASTTGGSASSTDSLGGAGRVGSKRSRKSSLFSLCCCFRPLPPGGESEAAAVAAPGKPEQVFLEDAGDLRQLDINIEVGPGLKSQTSIQAMFSSDAPAPHGRSSLKAKFMPVSFSVSKAEYKKLA
eukprot:jgi/Mesen1/8988/ME000056S08396